MILTNISLLEPVENNSKILNQRFALFKEVFDLDNYQDTINVKCHPNS